MRITEIFHSIQGESTHAGRPCVFVRLTGCNLRCVWCDSEYTFGGGERMSIDEVMDRVGQYGCKLVEVTGGEPLAQAESFDLIKRLCDEGYEVLIETSGSIDIAPVDPRAKIILAQGEDRTFVPFDRFAQLENSKGKSLSDLLDEFAERRRESLGTLRSWNLTDEELGLEGMHPELGQVTLRQLLATWVVHDLNHVRQIVTAMAGNYGEQVGPWKEYLSILK